MKLTAAAQELRQAAEEELSGSNGEWCSAEYLCVFMLAVDDVGAKFIGGSSPDRIVALLSALEALAAWRAWELVADSGMTLGEPVLAPMRERAFELRDAALAACRAAGLVEDL